MLLARDTVDRMDPDIVITFAIFVQNYIEKNKYLHLFPSSFMPDKKLVLAAIIDGNHSSRDISMGKFMTAMGMMKLFFRYPVSDDMQQQNCATPFSTGNELNIPVSSFKSSHR